MPAGCNFICKNEQCDYFNERITINGRWPVAKIDDVINSEKVKKVKEFQKSLIERKEDGIEYACIQFPNEDGIKVVGDKTEFWCKECRAILSWYAVDEDIEIEKCPICKEESLLGFDEVIEEGIECPYCGEETEQRRWFC